MISHFLMGFLTTIVATALALQSLEHTARNGDNGIIEAAGPNQSASASARVQCACCWRDCDPQTAHTQVLRQTDGSIAKASLTMSNVDAWLVVTLHDQDDLDWNMYTPILETVKVAVESYGSVARIVRLTEMDNVIQSIKVAAAQGKRPLLVSVAHDWAPDVPLALNKLKEAKTAGAYLVTYQSEPAFNDADRYGHLKQMTKWMESSTFVGADEIWDYTFAHVGHYQQPDGAPIIRYVPPGYVSKLDVGVDMKSSLTQASTIGYMGKPKYRGMTKMYQSLLGKRLYETDGVWNDDDLRTYLETYPLQLNQHRIQTCCPHEAWEDEHQHVEAFRMSTLLANKACVISGPSAIKDMNKWKGMVTFAEVDETLPAMDRLAHNLDECRTRSYETYKREFDPKKLLIESGLFQAWKPPHGI